LTGGGREESTGRAVVDGACPLCGGWLAEDQEWCLRCGAAARTRLAGAPHWKGPLVGLGIVAALALGVLGAALVKLTGSSGSSTGASAITRTVTVPATTAGAGALGGAAGTLGGGTASGGTGAGAGATGTTTGPGGVVNPGTPTTIKPAGEGGGTATTGAAGRTGTTGTRARERLEGARRERVGGLSLPSEEALRRAGFLRRGRR